MAPWSFCPPARMLLLSARVAPTCRVSSLAQGASPLLSARSEAAPPWAHLKEEACICAWHQQGVLHRASISNARKTSKSIENKMDLPFAHQESFFSDVCHVGTSTHCPLLSQLAWPGAPAYHSNASSCSMRSHHACDVCVRGSLQTERRKASKKQLW